MDPMSTFTDAAQALGLDQSHEAAVLALGETLYNAALIFSIEHMKRHVDAELTKGEDATLRKLSNELVSAGNVDLTALVAAVRG